MSESSVGSSSKVNLPICFRTTENTEDKIEELDNTMENLDLGDNSEEFDDNNNPVLNPTNVTRGANHLAEGDTTDSLSTRVKIQLSADEWNTIKAVIEHGTAIPVDASKEVLQGYHYAQHQQSRQLAKEKTEIRKRRESVSAAS
jgi:hypothetical protein